jgi:hypothetical protein
MQSYLDIHIYPFEENYNIATDLNTEEWSNMNFTKPVISVTYSSYFFIFFDFTNMLGEFGAYKPSFPNIVNAAYTVESVQIQSCSNHFSGTFSSCC